MIMAGEQLVHSHSLILFCRSPFAIRRTLGRNICAARNYKLRTIQRQNTQSLIWNYNFFVWTPFEHANMLFSRSSSYCSSLNLMFASVSLHSSIFSCIESCFRFQYLFTFAAVLMFLNHFWYTWNCIWPRLLFE